MSFDRSFPEILDGLTPEDRRLHIDWCLTIGTVDAAMYHFRMLRPRDFAPGEQDALYRRIHDLKESGWNITRAVSKGALPPNPIQEKYKQRAAQEAALTAARRAQKSG